MITYEVICLGILTLPKVVFWGIFFPLWILPSTQQFPSVSPSGIHQNMSILPSKTPSWTYSFFSISTTTTTLVQATTLTTASNLFTSPSTFCLASPMSLIQQLSNHFTSWCQTLHWLQPSQEKKSLNMAYKKRGN